MTDNYRPRHKGAERRKSHRRQVSQFARIVSGDGSWSGPCMMLDVSSTGARLQVNDTRELPDEFVLVLSRNGRVRRRCRIVWRGEHLIGIHFSFPSQRPSVQSPAAILPSKEPAR
jgi:hypothetical protein